MEKISIESNSKVEYIFLFLIIYVENSFYLRTQYSAMVRYCILLGMCFIFILYKMKSDRNLFFYKKTFFYFWLILFLISISSMLHMEINKSYFSYIISIFIAFIIVNYINFYKVKDIYSNIMYIICLFAFITIIIAYIAPEIIYKFPVIENSYAGEGREYFLGLNVINMGSQYRRNKGCFFEHGMFSIYIAIAIIFEFSDSKKISRKKIIVYILTLLSTMSTTGWIIAGGTIICLLISESKYVINRKFKFIIIIFVVFIFIIYPYLPQGYEYLFAKFTEGTTEGTFAERMSSIKVAIMAIFNNPIIGSSNKYISNLSSETISNIMTNTPLNWIAYYGIFVGIFCNLGIILFIWKINNIRKCKIVCTLFFIAAMMTQNMMQSIIINMMIFYGFYGLYEEDMT